MSDTLPPALAHGTLDEVLPNVFYVQGTLSMPGRMPMRFSRSMTVVRQAESLTVINSMRLDDAGLAALDKLGTVEHLLRIAGFHGRDDRFYKQRYDATVWAVKNQPYARGFNANPKPEHCYFQPDKVMDDETRLPIAGATLKTFPSAKPGEGIVRLDVDGGALVTGDALQNWANTKEFFSLPAKLMMRVMGFIKPCNVGPGWLKGAKPDSAEVRSILDLEFEHVLPAHGTPVIGGAKEKFRPAIERAS